MPMRSSAATCTTTIRAGLQPSPMLEALLAHQMCGEGACQKDLLFLKCRTAMPTRWHWVNQTQSRQQGRSVRHLASELWALGGIVILDAMPRMPAWALSCHAYAHRQPFSSAAPTLGITGIHLVADKHEMCFMASCWTQGSLL